MKHILLRQVSTVFLLLIILLPLNLLAQSNVEQIIRQYEEGKLTNYTATEKQIISEFLDSWQTPDNISLIKNIPPEATIFLDEDFTGQVLPTGWTNVDNTASSGIVWDFTDPGGRAPGGNFDADFAICDSDNAGSGNPVNATLTTIAVDCNTATTVTLGFDNYFNNLTPGTDYGLVEISNDGSTWTQVDSISSDIIPPAYVEYDVTAVAAGQSTVYVRWTYNDANTWAWYWAIDNVVLYEPDPTPLPAVLVSPPDAGTGLGIFTTLNWIAGGGAAPTGYTINFGTDNPPTNIENGTDLGLVTTYNPSSLAYSTTYYWEIIPYNGAGNATGTTVWSFTTMADPTISTFPYSEDFDTGTGTTPPAGWTQDPGNVEDWEFINNPAYAGQDHTSGTGMVAYVDDSTPYDNPSNMFSPPFDLTGLTTPTLSFYCWVGVGNLGPSYLNLDVYNGSVWVDSVITAVTENNMWVNISLDLTAYQSASTQFRFRGIENLSGFNCDVAIDDFSIFDNVTPPNCAVNVSPLDLAIDVANTADLVWGSGGGAPTGYVINFGTDNPPTNILNNFDNGASTTYDPTLSYSTTYYWQIVPYNGFGSATGCAVWSFTTEADPTISTFPWLEAFEGTFPPINWGRYVGLLADPTVLNTGNEWFQDDWLNVTLTQKSARCNIFGTTRDGWLLTPPIDLGTGTNYQLEFDLALTDYANSNPPEDSSGVDDKFAVVISTDGGNTWTSLNTLKLWDDTGANYYHGISYTGQHEIIDLTGYTGVVKFGFYGESTVSNADNDLFVDNVLIQEIPLAPVFSITPTSMDYGTVNIGESSPDETFTISNIGVGTLTITSGSITLVGADASEFVLTDLNSYPINLTTGQTATVDVNFSPTTEGVKTADLQIVDNTADGTNLVPLTGTGYDPSITSFPWNDDLETPGAPGTPLGWTQDAGDDFDWTFDAGGTPSTGTGPSVDHNPGTALGTYGFTESSANYGNTANIWSPPFDVSGLTNPVVSFWYHMYGATMGTLSVDYSTDDGATWTNGWTLSGDQGDVWYDAGFSLPTDADYVRFSGLTGTSFTSDIAFDDVSIFDNVLPPGCAVNVSPLDAATDVYAGTDLDWSSGSGITDGYKLFFGSDNPPTNIENGTDLGNVTTYDPASDLSYNTTYYWQVIAYNVNGDATGCSVWSFTTQSDPTITTFPWVETFEEDSPSRPAWIQIQEAGTGLWTYNVGAGAGLITTAYEDSLNARFLSGSGGEITKLVTPPLDLTSVIAPRVTFAYGQEFWSPDQNELKVYYRVSSSDPWVEVAHFTDNIDTWTETAVFLPNGSATYQIAFEGINNFGRANVLDSVTVHQGPPNDVATVSIDMAASYTPGSVTPLATVGNYGSDTQTFDVTMTIGAYTSTKTVTALTTGSTVQVTFDAWNATLGAFTVDATTQLTPDADSSNNSKQLDVVVASGTWSSGTVMPDNVYLGSGTALNGFVYSVGGNTNSGLSTECYKYEVATDTWTTIAPLPVGKVVHAVAYGGSYVYAIGGSSAASGVYTDTVYQYNPTLDSWTQVASLPAAIGWPQAVGYNGTHIYVAGGIDLVSGLQLSTVYVYDVALDTWSAATSMPGERFGGAFSVTGNMLVYVSGIDLVDFNDSVYVGTIDGVDPTLITWVNAAKTFPGKVKELTYRNDNVNPTDLIEGERQKSNNSPEAVYPPGGVYKFGGAAPWGSDAIIVAGGNDGVGGFWTAVNHCYVYNPTTDTWSAELPMPIGVLGGSAGSVNSGGIWKFVVAAGYHSPVVEDATQIYTVDMGGSSTFALTVTVADGWNMVSVPGTNPAGMLVTDWWSGKDPGADVFKYNAGYLSVTTTAPTEGYWMKNVGPQVYSYPAINIVSHTNISAAAGWNMIGGYENTVPVGALFTIPPGQITGTIFEYSGGYNPATDIVPGYGYWVKLLTAAQIGGLGAPPLGKVSNPVAEYIQEDWGKITITDNAGVSYTLYAVNGEVDLTQYELPPSPPAGMFDIRFGSDRIAEDISSSTQSIDMSGIQYPITVSVEGMDIRVQDESGNEIDENVKSGDQITISNSQINKLMVSGELIPDVYALEQNYPNPFNPSTVIEFSLPEDVAEVNLTIYDVLGQRVAQLVNTSLVAGKYKYQWDARNVASGMYIYELRANKFVSVKKMMFLK